MLGFNKKKNTDGNKVANTKGVNHKYRFERPYSNHQSLWRKPQGLYVDDVDAHKRLDEIIKTVLTISQGLSIIMMILIFFGMGYMIIFGNFENVIMDDGSQLFCTVLKDGSVGIAY